MKECATFTNYHHGSLFGSLIVYAFDTRRSDLSNRSLAETEFDDVVMAYFQDTDEDVLNYNGGRMMRNGTRQTIQEILYHGLISESALTLLFERNFNRCPEQYPITTILLGLYMLAANVMLVNLLVALFATTYDSVHG